MNELLDAANSVFDDVVAFRRDLHQHPELGLDNPRTQEKILDALEDLPLEIRTGEGLTSVVADLDGTEDGQGYSVNASDYWKLVFHHHPFESMMLNYNGYDATTQPVTPGEVPEFYWFLMARWNSRNGGNEWDIDADGNNILDSEQSESSLISNPLSSTLTWHPNGIS